MAAVSSTAPVAVTHERCGFGERKKFKNASDVWVSSSSTNHNSHCSQTPGRRSMKPVRAAWITHSAALGGVPARTDNCDTETSRRLNAAYIVGRYEMSSASIVSPRPASAYTRNVAPVVEGVAKPSVNNAEPDSLSATSNGTARNA